MFPMKMYSTLMVILMVYCSWYLCNAETSEEDLAESSQQTEKPISKKPKGKASSSNRTNEESVTNIIYTTKTGREIPHIKKQPEIREALAKHMATVIFLHGNGERGAGWANSLAEIKNRNLKVICPNANPEVITTDYGQEKLMTSWFSDSKNPNSDISQRATNYMHNLIDHEISLGIKPERIFLGGFSQGGDLALQSALTYPYKLGGIILLFSSLMKPKTLQHINEDNLHIPILHIENEGGGAMYTVLSENAMRRYTHVQKYHKFLGLGDHIPQGTPDMKKFFRECLATT